MINEDAVKKITMPSDVKSVRDVLCQLCGICSILPADHEECSEVRKALAKIRAVMPSEKEIDKALLRVNRQSFAPVIRQMILEMF